MGKPILKIENLSKQYRLGTISTGTLSHDLNRWWHTIRGKEDPYLKIGQTNDRSKAASSDYVYALKDISFEVQPGEVLGIIGKNGAGKSTLLKILSRITNPTTGSVKTRGRIASLLEVGTGFHQELTGRENIYLNGAILGMTRREISQKIEEIIEFSGCAMYIDTPVKRYSSGMTVRLAFAVAAHLEPDILVVDEVLAVGDVEFQKKAIGKMQDISKSEGRTVLFVSHNMVSLKHLCTRGILLENGMNIHEGDIESVIAHYLRESGEGNTKFQDLVEKERSQSAEKLLTRIEILTPLEQIKTCKNLRFKVDFNLKKQQKVNLGYLLKDEFGNNILASNTIQYGLMLDCTKGNHSIEVVVDNLSIVPGTYSISLFLANQNTDLDIIENAIYIHVHWNNQFQFDIPKLSWGPSFSKSNWSLISKANK